MGARSASQIDFAIVSEPLLASTNGLLCIDYNVPFAPRALVLLHLCQE